MKYVSIADLGFTPGDIDYIKRNVRNKHTAKEIVNIFSTMPDFEVETNEESNMIFASTPIMHNAFQEGSEIPIPHRPAFKMKLDRINDLHDTGKISEQVFNILLRRLNEE